MSPTVLRKNLRLYGILFALFWTALVAISGAWQFMSQESQITGLAKAEARSIIERDLLSRRWAAMHGEFYVPVTEKTQPIRIWRRSRSGISPPLRPCPYPAQPRLHDPSGA